MLNRTNRTLSASSDRLNLGTRSLALTASNLNVATTLRAAFTHPHDFMRTDSMRGGRMEAIGIKPPITAIDGPRRFRVHPASLSFVQCAGGWRSSRNSPRSSRRSFRPSLLGRPGVPVVCRNDTSRPGPVPPRAQNAPRPPVMRPHPSQPHVVRWRDELRPPHSTLWEHAFRIGSGLNAARMVFSA